MALDFPNSPTLNQTFTTGGMTWKWDGTKWLPTTASQPTIVVSSTPPSSPGVGTFWWDTNSGNLYVWYDDVSSQQWVIANQAIRTPPAVPAAGSRVLIQRQDIFSAVTTVDFTSGIDGTYDEYELHYHGVQTTGGSFMFLRSSSNNGSTWDAGTGYGSVSVYMFNSGGTVVGFIQGNATGFIQCTNSIDALAGTHACGEVKFWPKSGLNQVFKYEATTRNSANGLFTLSGSAQNNNTTIMNGLRIGANTGTITAGTFVLYGIAK